MPARIVVTRRARADIEKLIASIAPQSERDAKALARDLYAAIREIAANPLASPVAARRRSRRIELRQRKVRPSR